MKQHYIKLIEELDKTLSLVRSYWISGRDEFEKGKWMKRINELLDERLKLMNLRDIDMVSEPSPKAPTTDGSSAEL